jgi:predicted glycosyltransferase
MTPSRRQAAFDRLLASLAKKRARRLGLAYAGTIRKLPPPPLPGERHGETRYYLNAVGGGAKAAGLVELSRAANAELRRAERWAETGKGRKPSF